MALEVIGAGFGRTGTLSLKVALEKLGFSKCHHMQEVLPNRKQLAAWHAIAHGAKPDWDDVFEGFAASCDWPSCTYFEELMEHYPDAKVVLTVRDPERWHASAMETIYPTTNEAPAWLSWVVPPFRKLVELTHAGIWGGTFDGRFPDRAHAVRVFEAHNERVKRVVPPERLLVFRATDGWEPLCEFLGVPVPEGPYPHVNEARDIRRVVTVLRGLRYLPHAVAAGVALWLVLSW
jgi:hypothetical protein